MSYKVSILGKTYELPARTIDIDDHIEALSKLDKQYNSGEITRREAVTQMHSFVEQIAPGSLPSVNDVDTNDLMKSCIDIINAYDAPARKARNEAKLTEIRDLLSRPEVAKLFEVAKEITKNAQ